MFAHPCFGLRNDGCQYASINEINKNFKKKYKSIDVNLKKVFILQLSAIRTLRSWLLCNTRVLARLIIKRKNYTIIKSGETISIIIISYPIGVYKNPWDVLSRFSRNWFIEIDSKNQHVEDRRAEFDKRYLALRFVYNKRRMDKGRMDEGRMDKRRMDKKTKNGPHPKCCM